jgi:hypothetical protein
VLPPMLRGWNDSERVVHFGQRKNGKPSNPNNARGGAHWQAAPSKNKALATAGDGADPAALRLRSEPAFIIAAAEGARGCDAAQLACRGHCGTLGAGRRIALVP